MEEFNVGGLNLLSREYISQDKMVVYEPEIEPGLVVFVDDFTNFAGTIASCDYTIESLVVKVNYVVVPEEELATKKIMTGDTVVVSVTAEDELSTRHYKVTFVEAEPPVIPLMEMEKLEVSPIPGEELDPEIPPTDELAPSTIPENGDDSGTPPEGTPDSETTPGNGDEPEITPEDTTDSGATPEIGDESGIIPEVMTPDTGTASKNEDEPEITPEGTTDSKAAPDNGDESGIMPEDTPDTGTAPENDATPESPAVGGTNSNLDTSNETVPAPASDSIQEEGSSDANIAPPMDAINTGENLTLNANGTIGTSYTSSIFSFIFNPTHTTARTMPYKSTLIKTEVPAIIRFTIAKWEI